MFYRLKNLKNNVDFSLRNTLRWGYAVRDDQVSPLEFQFQEELYEFLQLFDWNVLEKNKIKVLDIGTRNFASGPVIEQLFRVFEINAEIHGLEIDAYRRLANFHVRADYGKYFANKMQNGFFHAMDFLEWAEKADVVFLLNPFVTKEPLLNWGLPTKHFQPQAIFKKVKQVLNPGGHLVLSCPNFEELEESTKLATACGFQKRQDVAWCAGPTTLHKKDRLGLIFTSPKS